MEGNSYEYPAFDPDLMKIFMGCLLYKLGGEIKITPEEIDEIKKSIGGFQVLLTADDAIVLKIKTPEAYQETLEALRKLELEGNDATQ